LTNSKAGEKLTKVHGASASLRYNFANPRVSVFEVTVGMAVPSLFLLARVDFSL
jgi:hypothetical protein